MYVPRAEMPFMTNFFKKVTNLSELEITFQTLLWSNNGKNLGTNVKIAFKILL